MPWKLNKEVPKTTHSSTHEDGDLRPPPFAQDVMMAPNQKTMCTYTYTPIPKSQVSHKTWQKFASSPLKSHKSFLLILIPTFWSEVTALVHFFLQSWQNIQLRSERKKEHEVMNNVAIRTQSPGTETQLFLPSPGPNSRNNYANSVTKLSEVNLKNIWHHCLLLLFSFLIFLEDSIALPSVSAQDFLLAPSQSW